MRLYLPIDWPELSERAFELYSVRSVPPLELLACVLVVDSTRSPLPANDEVGIPRSELDRR